MRNPGQDERGRRAQRQVQLAGAAPTADQLHQLAAVQARSGVRTDWALGLLLAWPRLKRGAWKEPDRLTYDEAYEVVRAAYEAMGWRPKLMERVQCPHRTEHERADEVEREVGPAAFAAATTRLPYHEELEREREAHEHPERFPIVMLMRHRPELRGWIPQGRCPTRCDADRTVYGLNAVLSDGFPLERDPDWQPIPFGALISPDYDWYLARSGSRTVYFRRWEEGLGRWRSMYDSDSFGPQPMVPPYLGECPAAWRYGINFKDFALYLFNRAVDALGLRRGEVDPATAAAEARREEHRRRRGNPDARTRHEERDRDPHWKLEAWRRGQAVPPDDVSQGIWVTWELPSGDRIGAQSGNYRYAVDSMEFDVYLYWSPAGDDGFYPQWEHVTVTVPYRGEAWLWTQPELQAELARMALQGPSYPHGRGGEDEVL